MDHIQEIKAYIYILHFNSLGIYFKYLNLVKLQSYLNKSKIPTDFNWIMFWLNYYFDLLNLYYTPIFFYVKYLYINMCYLFTLLITWISDKYKVQLSLLNFIYSWLEWVWINPGLHFLLQEIPAFPLTSMVYYHFDWLNVGIRSVMFY